MFSKSLNIIKIVIFLLIAGAVVLTVACKRKKPHIEMRGVVLITNDMRTLDWARLAHESEINTIGMHITPSEIVGFIQSEEGKKFMENCRRYGISVEHRLQAMNDLLPRILFDTDSTMFRMDQNRRRVNDCNLCVHSQRALDTVASNAVKYARLLPTDNHRYYFRIDNVRPMCACPECSQYSESEQALILENRMITALREFDPQAQLAHLAYANTLSAPCKVKPVEGVFLEFAPTSRKYEKVFSEECPGLMYHLKKNMEVFPAETAVVLEYWLDVSMFSKWRKPAVKLPWNRTVFEADIDEYAKLGIRNITTFAAYIDNKYVERYGNDMTFLNEYGTILKNYTVDKTVDKKSDIKPQRKELRTGKRIDDGQISVDGIGNEAAWHNAVRIAPFSNPWSDVCPETSLSILHDSRNVYFLYDVNDNNIVLVPNFSNKLDVAKEDRVELFFSKDSLMKEYYCFEIDPASRTLAYSCSYYRQYNYGWESPAGYVAAASRRPDGYTVEIAIPKTFLSGLMQGFKLYFGAYRAEYIDQNGTVVEEWQTWQSPSTEKPDFHVPESLGKLLITN